MDVTPLDCHSVTKLQFGADDAPKKLLVTVCIHGNEVCGLLAVNELLQEGFFKHGFDKSSTRVTILLGNPRAVMENKRYIDRNLNRMFVLHECDKEPEEPTEEPYEQSRLEEIISEMHQCDCYLDLHSTSAPTVPFAIVPPGEKTEALAKKFPVKFILHNVLNVINGTSVDYVKQLNKPGVCVECGQHREEETTRVAKETIKAFITGIPADHLPKTVLYVDRSVILREGFHFKKSALVKAFDYVDCNEVVAEDNAGEIRCPYKQGAFLVMPVGHPTLGEEAWLWGHTHDIYNEEDELVDTVAKS
jgi:succinylglutamate desuccinylase